ncbi:hypothetical protein [Corallococcus macrosporus]|uniref:Uncharacterized protein n=1 Tax=Corallococcus macrosporus DSM 14697 TaxID=1189310 RepID=A0A250JUG9_9BACT|nr:hypothetical protein [Corallococcus macrosporus]ATB47504.1 hypothetical protein MYMAC_003118 [Corallococcus macrosporus DSM 14697]
MNRIATALVAALLLTGSAQAQGHGPRSSRVERRELRDDRRDLEALRKVLSRFDAAWANRSERQMVSVESSLRKLLRAELAESQRELAKDWEASRRTRRNARVSQWGGPRAAMWGRAEAVNARGDLRAEHAALRTRKAIARELDEIEGLRQPGALHHKRTLILELIQVAERELNQSRREVRDERRPHHGWRR